VDYLPGLSFEPWSSWSLPPEHLRLQVWATTTQLGLTSAVALDFGFLVGHLLQLFSVICNDQRRIPEKQGQPCTIFPTPTPRFLNLAEPQCLPLWRHRAVARVVSLSLLPPLLSPVQVPSSFAKICKPPSPLSSLFHALLLLSHFSFLLPQLASFWGSTRDPFVPLTPALFAFLTGCRQQEAPAVH
jgi:hypothetical protein